MVEAVRVGTIIARDRVAASKWSARRMQSGPGGKGLTGKSLDQTLRMIEMRTAGSRYVGGRSGNNIKTEKVN